ncbi:MULTISPECIES: hypothetical protein [unclassified Bradyrhizobium]|uniref:hypothetical protein n=1 Tax=unclassified Bradyrhizobium TaxID=2631580 RepID=UPI002915E365|nr:MULTISPECIES: hypothetical protein [unclassified Bradyrhizobium]
MTDDTTFGGSLSPEETAFFETGGESGIPTETGSDNSGGASSVTSGGEVSSGGDKPAETGTKPQDRGPQHVPLAALQEERNRRRDLDKQLREAREKLANFEGRFAVLERASTPGGQEQAQDGPPAPEDDIFGAVKALQARLDGQDEAAKAERAVADERTKFVRDYQADAAQFEQTTPDFKQAYAFLLNSRAAELKAIGYEDPRALHDALTADEFAIAQMAFQKGKSPSEMLYALATQRGYVKADGKKPDTSAAEKLNAIERGQAANKSLNATGGSTGDADMTAERLLSMPMAEFEAWVEKHPAKAKRLMGG